MLISCLLVAVLALGFYFLFNKKQLQTEKYLREHSLNKKAKESVNIELKVSDALKAKHSVVDGPPVENCHVHDEVQAQAFCSICKSALCENCVREDENIYFCAEHFRLYLNEDWVELETVFTTPNNPEDGMYIYEFHERMWTEDQTPTFITTHYKIDVELDHIESEVKLMVRKEEKDLLKKKLSQIIQ